MFFDKVELLCANKGISITKLTHLLGLSSSVITGWKNGAKPRMSTVKMIADFFRVSPEYLLSPQAAAAPADGGTEAAGAIAPEGYDKLTQEEKQEVCAIINFFISRKRKNGEHA